MATTDEQPARSERRFATRDQFLRKRRTLDIPLPSVDGGMIRVRSMSHGVWKEWVRAEQASDVIEARDVLVKECVLDPETDEPWIGPDEDLDEYETEPIQEATAAVLAFHGIKRSILLGNQTQGDAEVDDDELTVDDPEAGANLKLPQTVDDEEDDSTESETFRSERPL